MMKLRGWFRKAPLITSIRVKSDQRLPELGCCCFLIGRAARGRLRWCEHEGRGAESLQGGPAWWGRRGESNCGFDIYWPLSSHLRRGRSQKRPKQRRADL